jgi:hypothetical protein
MLSKKERYFMKTIIYCKPTEKGMHSFYLINGDEEYYLFSQAYRRSVANYYGRGVLFDNAIKYSKAHNDSAITRTMTKLPMYIRYIEKEYGIYVLDKTKKNMDSRRIKKEMCSFA